MIVEAGNGHLALVGLICLCFYIFENFHNKSWGGGSEQANSTYGTISMSKELFSLLQDLS